MVHVDPADPLQVHLQRLHEDAFEPDSVTEAPLVRFSAYTRRHRVLGWVRLTADRLTDLLNAHDGVALEDVDIEDVRTGEAHAVDRVVIPGIDLVAVHASGPRGDATLRQRTHAAPVAMQAGHYLVGGHLHSPPGRAPLAALGDRAAMVPLTDAWIEYWSDGARSMQSTGTIIVNRHAMDWIRGVSDEDLIDGALRPTS